MACMKKINQRTAELDIDGNVTELEIPRPQQCSEEENSSQPKVNVELEWIYGYRGRDVHKTMVFLPDSEELIYFTACVVIIHDLKIKRQRFYREHDCCVSCIALNPDQNTIATGQEFGAHKRPAMSCVLLWKGDTLETIATLKFNEGQNTSISHVCFSGGGLYIGVVSVADCTEITVWEWRSESCIARSCALSNPINDIEFNPLIVCLDPAHSHREIVSISKGQLLTWSMNENKLNCSRVDSNREDPQSNSTYFMCFRFSPSGDLVAGDSCGYLHVWMLHQRSSSFYTFSGCSSPVVCIAFACDGSLFTGNLDGLIAGWDRTYSRHFVYHHISSCFGSARTILPALNDEIFIGTTRNFILTSKFGNSVEIVVSAHADRLNALASRRGHEFVTAGKDKKIFLWDAVNHCHVWHSEIRFPASCVAVSPCDEMVAVGGITGQWVLLNGKKGHGMEYGRACDCPINSIGFSPIGSYIAMGAQNGDVYIYNVNEQTLSLLGKLSQPYGPVTHLDWAVDSHHIRTCSNDCNIFYWSIPKCAPDDSDYVRYDHYWWTKSCKMTYLAAGIWGEAVNLTDITSVDVNPSEKLMASGNDCGEVSVYKYPCPTLNASGIINKGHGTTVSIVKYLKGASRIISCGGDDRSIFQWKMQASSVGDDRSMTLSNQTLCLTLS